MIIKTCDFATYGVQITTERAAAPDAKEQVVYDLHIGKAYRTPGDANRHTLPKVIYLKPNDCVLLETDEELSVPANIFGVIVSRASLAAEGIVVANLKIDPRFYGRLTVTVINAGTRYLRIEQGMPFCSVFFQGMEKPADGNAPRTPPQARLLPSHRYRERFLASLPFVLTFAASVVASLLAAYLFIWMHGMPAR